MQARCRLRGRGRERRAVAEEVAANDHAALRAVKRQLRDRDDRATRERREAEAFADLAVERGDDRTADRDR